jgi:hypothetical protein
MTTPASTTPAPTAALLPAAVTMLPSSTFLIAAAFAAVVITLAGRFVAMPLGLLAVEVLATILGLFLFGSFRFQIHKNALTYGMLLVIVATFAGLSTSAWHVEIIERGWSVWAACYHSWPDDCPQIRCLRPRSFFVAVIPQTRLLRTIAMLLRLPVVFFTVLSVRCAFSSGIATVSPVGLAIRTLSSS